MSLWKTIKRFLGFAGVKVVLDVNTDLKRTAQEISGSFTITTTEDAEIVGIKVDVQEVYEYKSGDDTKKKYYTLGEWTGEASHMKAGDEKKVDFVMPFDFERGRGTTDAHQGGLTGGLGQLSNFMKGAKSEYTIRLVVDVKGVALDPMDHKKLTITG